MEAKENTNIEMNSVTVQAATMLDPAEEQRLLVWRGFGAEYGKILTEVKLSCSEIANRLRDLPSDEKKVVTYEQDLKKINQDINGQDEKRKTITRKIDRLTERCIEPIAELKIPVSEYEAALLRLKKQISDREKKEKAKAAEEIAIKEYFANHITTVTAQIRQGIVNAITTVFEYALANIDEAGLTAYLDKIKTSPKYAEAVFATLKPSTISPPAYHTSDEVDAFWAAIHTDKSVAPSVFRTEFETALTERFEFYNVSLTNKAASLELSKKEAADSAASIESAKTNEVIANKLGSMATAPIVSSGGKALKSVFKLELENNESNTKLLLAAMVANIDSVLPLIKTKTFFETIKKAVVDFKNKDEKFEFTGIKFEVEEKL